MTAKTDPMDKLHDALNGGEALASVAARAVIDLVSRARVLVEDISIEELLNRSNGDEGDAKCGAKMELRHVMEGGPTTKRVLAGLIRAAAPP